MKKTIKQKTSKFITKDTEPFKLEDINTASKLVLSIKNKELKMKKSLWFMKLWHRIIGKPCELISDVKDQDVCYVKVGRYDYIPLINTIEKRGER